MIIILAFQPPFQSTTISTYPYHLVQHLPLDSPQSLPHRKTHLSEAKVEVNGEAGGHREGRLRGLEEQSQVLHPEVEDLNQEVGHWLSQPLLLLRGLRLPPLRRMRHMVSASRPQVLLNTERILTQVNRCECVIQCECVF